MAYTFYVKADNSELSRAIRSISAFDGKTRLRVENTVRKGTQAIGRDARKKAPVRSGGLRKSIRTSFKKNTVTGEVKAYAPHAHLLEYGVKSAVAVPKEKKALRIVDGAAARYAVRAKIPARRAHPFMKPAYDAHEGDILNDVEKAVKK